MDTENTTESETVINPKTALIQKAVIVGSAAIGIFISVGLKLPKVKVDTDDAIEVAGDSDTDTTES